MQANALRTVVEPVLGVHGLELEALTVQKAGSRDIVRVTVDGDGPSGRGPDLDDIARASRAVSQALDEAD
ncbi:MAG: ribosome maturation factor RimP, partial [Propionibacteriaceae bacterium]|nr:ribosome maturation factor RimP [Propionibacteriaceae bacterium]